MFAGLAHAERAHAAALMGDVRLAADAMAEADRRQRPTMSVLYPWVEQARAWVAVAAGEPDAAVDILRRLVDRLRCDGFHGHEVVALLDLVRLGEPAEAAIAAAVARRARRRSARAGRGLVRRALAAAGRGRRCWTSAARVRRPGHAPVRR